MQKKCPLLFPTCFYALGILIWTIKPINCFQLLPFTVIVLTLYCTLPIHKAKSILLLILFLFQGIYNPSITSLADSFSHFSTLHPESMDLVIKERQRTLKGFRYIANVKMCHSSTISQACRGRVLFYSDSINLLQLFDTYRVQGSLYEIEQYKNPGRFDYGKYLAGRDIKHRLRLDTIAIHIRGAGFLFKSARELRAGAKNHFNDNLKNKESSVLINAILLGEKSEMRTEFKSLFTNNGLAHLLAISGMHVGIILLILKKILGKIPSRILSTVLIIFGIWFYILLSGLQVPAVRAGLMFTIYTLGGLIERNTSGINSVLLSALILLNLDYHLLFQVSFQLSFLAMLSILLFYNPIYQLAQARNKWIKLVWQLLSLNVSVQILVLPICIYYFNQVPLYSILNSIISSPFILLIMWGGSFSLAFSKPYFIQEPVNKFLDLLVATYVDLLNYTSKLPFALLEDIYINSYQLITCLFCTLAFLYCINKYGSKPSISMACFIPLLLASSISGYQKMLGRQLIVYDDPKQIIIEIRRGSERLRFKQFPDLFSYQVESNEEEVKSHQLANYLEVEGTSIAIINASNTKIESKSAIDICVLAEKPLKKEELAPCRQFIIPRNSRYSDLDVKTYSISTNGAFIRQL